MSFLLPKRKKQNHGNQLPACLLTTMSKPSHTHTHTHRAWPSLHSGRGSPSTSTFQCIHFDIPVRSCNQHQAVLGPRPRTSWQNSPQSLRKKDDLALGKSQWQTACGCVVPASARQNQGQELCCSPTSTGGRLARTEFPSVLISKEFRGPISGVTNAFLPAMHQPFSLQCIRRCCPGGSFCIVVPCACTNQEAV